MRKFGLDLTPGLRKRRFPVLMGAPSFPQNHLVITGTPDRNNQILQIKLGLPSLAEEL